MTHESWNEVVYKRIIICTNNSMIFSASWTIGWTTVALLTLDATSLRETHSVVCSVINLDAGMILSKMHNHMLMILFKYFLMQIMLACCLGLHVHPMSDLSKSVGQWPPVIATPRKMFCWINKNFHWPICKRKTLLGQPNFCWFNKNLVGLTKFFF